MSGRRETPSHRPFPLESMHATTVGFATSIPRSHILSEISPRSHSDLPESGNSYELLTKVFDLSPHDTFLIWKSWWQVNKNYVQPKNCARPQGLGAAVRIGAGGVARGACLLAQKKKSLTGRSRPPRARRPARPSPQRRHWRTDPLTMHQAPTRARSPTHSSIHTGAHCGPSAPTQGRVNAPPSPSPSMLDAFKASMRSMNASSPSTARMYPSSGSYR